MVFPFEMARAVRMLLRTEQKIHTHTVICVAIDEPVYVYVNGTLDRVGWFFAVFVLSFALDAHYLMNSSTYTYSYKSVDSH